MSGVSSRREGGRPGGPGGSPPRRAGLGRLPPDTCRSLRCGQRRARTSRLLRSLSSHHRQPGLSRRLGRERSAQRLGTTRTTGWKRARRLSRGLTPTTTTRRPRCECPAAAPRPRSHPPRSPALRRAAPTSVCPPRGPCTARLS